MKFNALNRCCFDLIRLVNIFSCVNNLFCGLVNCRLFISYKIDPHAHCLENIYADESFIKSNDSNQSWTFHTKKNVSFQFTLIARNSERMHLSLVDLYKSWYHHYKHSHTTIHFFSFQMMLFNKTFCLKLFFFAGARIEFRIQKCVLPPEYRLCKIKRMQRLFSNMSNDCEIEKN